MEQNNTTTLNQSDNEPPTVNLLAQKAQTSLLKIAPICLALGLITLSLFIVVILLDNITLFTIFNILKIPVLVIAILALDRLISAKYVYKISNNQGMVSILIGIIAGLLPISYLQIANSTVGEFLVILIGCAFGIAVHTASQKTYLKDISVLKNTSPSHTRVEHSLRTLATIAIILGIIFNILIIGGSIFLFFIPKTQEVMGPTLIAGFIIFYCILPVSIGLMIALFAKTRQFRKEFPTVTSSSTLRMSVVGRILCLTPLMVILGIVAIVTAL